MPIGIHPRWISHVALLVDLASPIDLIPDYTPVLGYALGRCCATCPVGWAHDSG
ncbi:DUF1232 domain-containing protein [Glaciihabitans sp. UYNi722]|uniref:DUF1232 domain-containing protein n=1 Tax=Glaciihabitans sp. UYNi722 TaxID=3156344 RepID=UPI0033911A95